jgi:hypothetical protein
VPVQKLTRIMKVIDANPNAASTDQRNRRYPPWFR